MDARTAPADFMPERPGQLLESCALVGKPMATALLRELAHRRVAVALRRRCDLEASGFARIVECGEETLAFDLDPDPESDFEPGSRGPGLLPVPGDEDYVAVAYLDGVKVQFDARLRAAATGHDRRRLRGEPPLAVYRLQRRDAYRVMTASGEGRCALRRPPAGEFLLGIVDLSARGVLLAWDCTEPPAMGSVWEHARIEFAGRPPLPCTLVATRIDTSPDGHALVGCEFGPLPPEVERAIQVLVNDLQLAPRRGH